MPSFEIIAIAALVAVAWFWLDSLNVREAAVQAARAACTSEGLQLLDDTVSIAGLKTVRDAGGRVRLQRAYDFEYSDTGDNRRKGSLVMQGRQVVLFNVGLHEAQRAGALPPAD